MKRTSLVLMAAVVLILAGCAGPVVYDYQYQLVNTRTACEPEYETWLTLYNAFTYPETVLEQSDIELAYAEATKIVECTAGAVQGVISQRGADGWKLITFEALQPGVYDLGVEYIYRLVWERPK